MLIKLSRLTGESFKILWQDFSNFFIFQPLSSEPALKALWTVWRLQVPKSISFEWPSSSLESFTFCKSFKFTFGPSINNWTIFSISNNLSPSWRESCRSWWVVCPKNSEFQYLSSTLFSHHLPYTSVCLVPIAFSVWLGHLETLIRKDWQHFYTIITEPTVDLF